MKEQGSGIRVQGAGRRHSPRVLKFAEQYGVSPKMIASIGVKHMMRMSEDARLVLTNEAKRNWHPFAISAERTSRLNKKPIRRAAQETGRVERLMELARLAG